MWSASAAGVQRLDTECREPLDFDRALFRHPRALPGAIQQLRRGDAGQQKRTKHDPVQWGGDAERVIRRLDHLLRDLDRQRFPRVPGTAVFLTSDTEGAPVVLLHHLKHNKVLHEQVVLLLVLAARVPEIDDDARVKLTALDHGFFRVIATFGFMETPDVPLVLELCAQHGLKTRPLDTSYFLGRERLLPIGPSPMMRWRKKLFGLMARNARSATEFYGLPPNRVVELGAQIEF